MDIKSEFDDATRELMQLYQRTECPEERQTGLLTCYASFAVTFAEICFSDTLDGRGEIDPLVRCDPPFRDMLKLVRETNDRIGLGFDEFQSGCEVLLNHAFWRRIGELTVETPTAGSA